MIVISALLPEGGRAIDRSLGGPQRVLFVGNSYTRFNDLPGMVRELSLSVRGGPPLFTRSETHGGYDLRRHWNRRRVRSRIANGRFDWVVLQDHSTSPLREPQTLREYVRRFSSRVTSAGGRLVLFSTWARHPRSRFYQRVPSDARAMQERVDAVYGEIARELDVGVAPVGRAWLRASAELPHTTLHRRDGTHPALAGTYLSACVIYGTLTGRDPREARWRHHRLTPQAAARIRAIASESLRRTEAAAQ
jgi:uncharacterized protein DUF4886